MKDDMLTPVQEQRIGNSLDLRHYVDVLRKYRRAIVALTLLAFLGSLWYVLAATPIYRSTATLLIEPQRANVVSIEELVGVETETPDYYMTQFELLRSRSLAKKVISALDMWSDPELFESPETERGGLLQRVAPWLPGPLRPSSVTRPAAEGQSVAEPATSGSQDEPAGVDLERVRAEAALRERVVNRFLERLVIKPVGGTKLVRIMYDSADPVLAAEVANAIGEQYITSYLDTKLSRTARAAEWLGSRVSQLEEALDDSERRLLEFKRENGLIDVGGSVGRLSEQELLLATTELGNARTEVAGARSLFRQVRSLEGRSELLLSVPAVQLDPLVQRAKIDQAQARRELETLRNRYGPKHPRVLDAESELSSIQADLDEQLNRVAATIESDYRAAQQRLAAIEQKLASGKEEIQEIGAKRYELEALEREVQTNLEIYETFYSRMTEAHSADGMEATNASVADRAVPPEAPVKPRKALIVLLVSLAVFMIACFVALARDYLDDKVNDTSDIERELEVPVLGVLPVFKRGLLARRRKHPIRPSPERGGAFSESINSIRTTLSLTDSDHHRQVIVVTSSVPGEGKSSLSLNLAHSFGQMEKVLLIDGDLRRPTLARAARRRSRLPGLSTVIANLMELDKCIVAEQFEGAVDLLPAGPVPDQPLELLSSPRFARIIKELRGRYDRIIIDSAPVRAVSDALVLATVSDAVVYAIKAHDTPIELARRGLQRIADIRAPIAGIVLTQLKPRKAGVYEGNYYYEQYHEGPNGQKGRDGRDDGNRGPRLVLSAEQIARIRTDRENVDVDIARTESKAEGRGPDRATSRTSEHAPRR